MTRPCMQCGRLTETQPYGDGLYLCRACPPAAPCGEFQHDYRGRDTQGTWICLRCGHSKSSQPITAEVVPADQTLDASMS